jgi:cation diffusion facilitator CzcD-associated flavoprotein CzcO
MGAEAPGAGQDGVPRYDVLVIGAGPTGLFLLFRLRELGLSVKVFEAGGGVGGTWYWNRYPGARLDSESYTYGYAFSEEVLYEWEWSEHFASQPELERYYNYVADKLDLRRDVQLEANVTSVEFREEDACWHVDTQQGHRAIARFVIAAVGLLTAPNVPEIPGAETFAGEMFHTARWPSSGVELDGRRIGVFGTGASGVQVIAAVADRAEELVVFQRTPVYAAPMRNAKIGADVQREIKAAYPALIKKCRESAMGFMFDFDPRSALSVPPEERRRYYEELWAERGL